MNSRKKESVSRGFTCDKSQVKKHLQKFLKDYKLQKECKDVVKFIADKMDEAGILDKRIKIDKYKLINSFIIKNNELVNERSAVEDERIASILNPRNRNYDYGKSIDELD